MHSLQRLQVKGVEVVPLPVKTPTELARCDALIIPGGESTTITLLAKLSGLLEPLRDFVKTKSVWGTCAGAILLSKEVTGIKKGGQEVLGGVDIKVGRNGWGSQMESFEAEMTVDGMRNQEEPFKGVFIRAPVRFFGGELFGEVYDYLTLPTAQVVLALMPTTPSQENVEVIARLTDWVPPSPVSSPYASPKSNRGTVLPTPPNELETTPAEDPRLIVALRQGRHLVTTFHPELTRDDRFHELFVREFALKKRE